MHFVGTEEKNAEVFSQYGLLIEDWISLSANTDR